MCRGASALLKWGTWSAFVQSRFVPAQYFRDPEELDTYLEHSNFLADVNNERKMKNETYRKHLMMLNKFAMFMFGSDMAVIPKESALFAEVNRTSGEITMLRDRQVYKQDWLGLKALDKQGKLDFRTIPGEHMRFTKETLTRILKTYFGPVKVGDLLDKPLVVQDGL